MRRETGTLYRADYTQGGQNVTGKTPARCEGRSPAGGNHMAPSEKLPESCRAVQGRQPAELRQGLGAAGLPCRPPCHAAAVGFRRDVAAANANAAIDWKQFAGQTITLAGPIHPCRRDHSPCCGISPSSPYQRRYRLPIGERTWARCRSSSTVPTAHRRLMYTTYARASPEDGSSR